MSNQNLTEPETEWKDLIQAGYDAYAKRRHTEAELKFAAALRIAEKDSHLDQLEKLDESQRLQVNERLAKSLNNMAALYHTQGKYAMAEDLYRRCLDLNKQLHGDDHLEVAINMHNLAVLFSAKRRYEEAEPLYQKSLELKEQHLGATHADLVQHLNNYALLLRRTNREAAATVLDERAKKILAGSTTITESAK